MIKAIFFDVDFTLIYPGPTFQGTGYRDFCAEHDVTVDALSFDRAVAAAASTLVDTNGGVYDPEVFVQYTMRIIEHMGGSGAGVEQAARRIYDEWSSCHHFQMYEDVPDVLRTLHASGLKMGLISNTQRSLTAFQAHFALEGMFSAAVSSYDHGYMKPHRSIFEAALRLVGVAAHEAVMVGDSVAADIAGARGMGMRAVLVLRAGHTSHLHACPSDVPRITTLRELPGLL